MTGFRVEDFQLDYKANKSDLKREAGSPTFVEGLLGVGHVGLLASDHLVQELDCRKIAEVYSPHFSEPFSPGDTPGTVHSGNGRAKLHKNEIFYDSEHDLFVYKGLYQGDYCEFYYRHANRMMDFCDEFGVEEVYTLGGLGTGEEKEEPKTRAVVTDSNQAPGIGRHARILTGEKDMPGVTGLSGLLIGLASKNGMEGTSLLGETHGAFPDAKAAKSVLETLTEILEIDLDLSGLDEAAERIEERKDYFRERMKSMRQKARREPGDRRYVG